MAAHPDLYSFAQCACGEVHVHLRKPPQSVVNCHCGQCRHQSGAAYTTWASFALDSVVFWGLELVGEYAATPHVNRYFCKRCGTPMYAADRRMTDVIGIPAGVLRDKVPQPTAHYYVSDKAPWHTIADGLPQFGGATGREKLA